MSKSLTALNKMIEKYNWVGKEYCRLIGKNESLHKVNQEAFESLANIINQDLERLEKINEVWNDNEPMESVDINDEHLQELYDYINKLEKENEKLKQQRDRLAIDNGELCVKVTDLQKENQELKEENTKLLVNKNAAQILALNLKRENDKLKKAIEILKRFDFDIYAGKCLGFIQTSLEDPLTFDLDDFIEFQEYELLKEVLEYD